MSKPGGVPSAAKAKAKASAPDADSGPPAKRGPGRPRKPAAAPPPEAAAAAAAAERGDAAAAATAAAASAAAEATPGAQSGAAGVFGHRLRRVVRSPLRLRRKQAVSPRATAPETIELDGDDDDDDEVLLSELTQSPPSPGRARHRAAGADVASAGACERREEELWKEFEEACHIGGSSSSSSSAAPPPWEAPPTARSAGQSQDWKAALRNMDPSELLAAAPSVVVGYIQAQGWHTISTPAWEGKRWNDFIQQLEVGEADQALLVEQIGQKLRRQKAAAGLGLPRKPRPLFRAAAGVAAHAPPRAAKAHEPVPGCTCGLPIHSEKCKLFKPAAATAASSSRARPRAAPSPRQQKRKREDSPPRRKPSPADLQAPPNLSAWAKAEVAKVHAEVKALPAVQRKSTWKRRMSVYHPDKRLVLDSPVAGVPSEHVTEAFLELKRRYDLL